MKKIIIVLLMFVAIGARAEYVQPDPCFHMSQNQMKWTFRICALAVCVGGIDGYGKIRDNDCLGKTAHAMMAICGGYGFVYSWKF